MALHLCGSTGPALVADLAEAQMQCNVVQDISAVCASGEQQVHS